MGIYRDGNSFGDNSSKASEAGSVYTPGALTPTASNRRPLQGAAPTSRNLTAAKPVVKPVDNTPALPSYDDYTSGRSSYDNYTRAQLQQSGGSGGAERFPTDALQPTGTYRPIGSQAPIGGQAPITYQDQAPIAGQAPIAYQDQALDDDSALDYQDPLGESAQAEARIAELRARTGSSKNPLISGLRSFQDFYQF